jgi:hypothetical protein
MAPVNLISRLLILVQRLMEVAVAEVDRSSLPTLVREFRPNCPGCSPDKLSIDETRPCSFYDCPGLPKELEVTCNLCMYDFASGDGQPKCDHKTCETALRLQKNVPTYRLWLDLVRSEARLKGLVHR